jgi:predicted Na+-dependent transporter
VETQGPLAVIWVAAGLIAFYIALIWINSLLGLFLTPLFIIPLTWLQDRMKERRARKAGKRSTASR